MTSRGELFAVFGFETTHDAMRAERTLEDAAIEVTLIPTPKTLGTLCGLAARVPLVRERDAVRALEAHRRRTEPQHVHTPFFGEFLGLGYFVFVVFENDKLPFDDWSRGPHSLAG